MADEYKSIYSGQEVDTSVAISKKALTIDNIAQTTGPSPNLIMSQQAVTNALKSAKAATVQVGTTTTGSAGSSASVTNSGTEYDAILNFIIPRGDTGEKGNGITSIEKTSSSGLIDTYTITYDDGNTETFQITNADQIDIRYVNGQLQWKYETEESWTTLFTVDSTLSTASNNPIQNQVVATALNGKIDINQGASNTGKVLIVGNDGNVSPQDIPSSSGTVVNINGISQSQVNFTSDPQTQIDNIENNTTILQNSVGGFAAGEGSSTSQGGSIGDSASSTNGGAIGYNSKSTNGGAMGFTATTTTGGAIGSGSASGKGFSGGSLAKVALSGTEYIDAIQLGSGTNEQEKTLQIYDDNIYNATTHTLTVQNMNTTTLTIDNLNYQTFNTGTELNQFVNDNIDKIHSIVIIPSSNITGNATAVSIKATETTFSSSAAFPFLYANKEYRCQNFNVVNQNIYLSTQDIQSFFGQVNFAITTTGVMQIHRAIISATSTSLIYQGGATPIADTSTGFTFKVYYF